MIRNRMLVLGIAFFLDLILGDPQWFPHPIRFIGNLISWLDKKLRKNGELEPKALLCRGAIMTILVVLMSAGIPFLIILGCYRVSVILGIAVEAFLGYTLLATKSLKDESMKVYDALKKQDVSAARYAVSRIVGRDTERLDEEGITKAAVETVAENTSDGIIAPMIFLAIGGAAFGFFYKAINTMDSMVGYKNDNYLYFGRVAAKLDDVVNYLPARISAYLMILASAMLGMDWKQAARIHKRDCHNHASPNSAQTESVCAGALRVQLAGDAWYFGKLCKKPTIGDATRKVSSDDIKRANRLLYGTAILCLLLAEGILLLVQIGMLR